MPATALRGAESDVMGMLLRERIVFLGSSIDDFVAEAVMSQLLLLDAQDPTKDIRLFINSPGGSLSPLTDFDGSFTLIFKKERERKKEKQHTGVEGAHGEGSRVC
nr:ATP-dependent Clp protease proteolytic subunit 4, chloroplastic isoform X2 [Arachis hypogaea]